MLFVATLPSKSRQTHQICDDEKYYVYNVFITLIKKFKWLVIIGSNLNPSLKLLFNPPITISNNLLIIICYENVINKVFISNDKQGRYLFSPLLRVAKVSILSTPTPGYI